MPLAPNDLPACCTPSENATWAERLYCAYNRGGDPAFAGLNQMKPCPTWADLPENIQAKWGAVAKETGIEKAVDKIVELANAKLAERGL